ncbi:MAG: hypothetical protein K6C36_09690, partial [Clostridia bacterium]|nr:hypothetical protein [Clostridia bacterium]
MRGTLKKTLAVALTLFMAFSVFGGLSFTASAASTWDGTIGDPGVAYYYNSGDDYYLESARALVHFINRVANGTDFSGKTVHLLVDVDLAGIDFSDNVFPYNSDRIFKGTFDGGGHTISNFRMTSSNHRVAMFRTAQNATFRNVTFVDPSIDDVNNNGKNGFGALVGYGDGNLTFENVNVSGGRIYGSNYVGGLVGEYGANNTISFTGCSVSANIIQSDSDRAGGLVGHSKGSVVASDCHNYGEIKAGSSDGGGLAGWIEDDESSFTNCSNAGKVTASACAGGIFGYFGSDSQDKKMTIIGCSNSGEISSTGSAVGGIAGKVDTDNNYHIFTDNTNTGYVHTSSTDVGGIVGYCKGYGVWTNCFNSGTVTSTDDNAGGILGETEDDKQVFTNCRNTGAINGKYSTGGIMGWFNNASDSTYTRCFNTGDISSSAGKAGGIIGAGKKVVTCTECFNIGNIRGANDSGGLAGAIEYHTFFYRCFNAGTVGSYDGNTSKSYGGMIGYTSYNNSSTASAPQINECFNWGTINGAGYGGGFVGYVNNNGTYYISNSYNAGKVYGSTRYSGAGYGGNIGTNVYRLNTDNGGGSSISISEADLEGFRMTATSNFCRNTWGVRIGSTTYKFPILTWYRDMFTFESNFVDSASGTNETIVKTYGQSFTVPNPVRSGYGAGQWLSGKTHRLVRGSTVTAGDTYLLNTNYDKSSGPADTETVVQSFTDPTDVRSTRTYGLTWQQGAAANMYATAWNIASYTAENAFRAGIDYTIYNLTTGHDVSYTNGSTVDYNKPAGQYFKTYQNDGTGAATATLVIDRSVMTDISETGIYIDYYPFIYTQVGGVRWGVEIFDPADPDSRGVLDNTHYIASVTGASGKSYTYEQRFGDVNGNDTRCAETSSDFTLEPAGQTSAERRYGSYKWYFKGAAPDVDDSVTLRVTALCAARYSSDNLQILSEWTDITISSICTHSNGHLHAVTANAPTCTADGNSAYWYCDLCGKYYSDAEATDQIDENSWILNATGHQTYNEGEWTWTPTDGGYTASVAVSCAKGDDSRTLDAAVTLSENVPAGHLDDGHKTYTATATIGSQTFTDTKTDVITAEGHSFEWIIDTDADCGNPGVKHEECSVCHATRNENTVIPATGEHSYEWTVDTPADCGNPGDRKGDGSGNSVNLGGSPII